MYSQKSIVFFLTLIFLSIFTYGQANLSSGLTAYYPLDGNARDYSGNSFDGNIYEATPTQDRFGNYNHAYSFDGNNDFIGLGNNFGDIFSNGNRQFAFSFWFKCNNLSGTNILIDKAASNVCSESQYEWVIRTKDSHLNFVAFYSLDGTNARNIECYKTLNTNTWYHVVGNFDGNNTGNNGLDQYTVYINSQEEATFIKVELGNISKIDKGTAHLGLGNNLTSNGFNCGLYNLNGAIDDVFFYDRTLTTTEIDILYNKTSDINIPKAKNSFTVYPTLVNKTLFINSNVSGNFQLKIIDIDGKLISENSFTNSTNPIKQDVSNLKDGVYFVQIITNNNCSTKKFIKF